MQRRYIFENDRVAIMPFPTIQIPRRKFEELRQHLKSLGFEFESRAHQVFLAKKRGAAANLFSSGKLTLSGSDERLLGSLYKYLTANLGAEALKSAERKLEPLKLKGKRIGTDEAGKGDYFGPLVIAGALIDEEAEEVLRKINVRDSKTLSDASVARLASQIKKILGAKCEVVAISPSKYNLLYEEMKNLNKILGWGHARAIENLLEREECSLAVADKFGDASYIKNALMKKGQRIELVQVHRAERDIAVAAASVLARDRFLREMEKLGNAYGAEFPKGAANVVEFGRKFALEHGAEALGKVAKLHFATTKEITGKASARK